jgi:hypothetical protein
MRGSPRERSRCWSAREGSGPSAGLGAHATVVINGVLDAWIAVEFLSGSPRRAIRWFTALLLLVLTTFLIRRGATAGWGARCGCISLVMGQSVLGALVRNLFLTGLLIGPSVWAKILRNCQLGGIGVGGQEKGT